MLLVHITVVVCKIAGNLSDVHQNFNFICGNADVNRDVIMVSLSLLCINNSTMCGSAVSRL